MSSSLQGVYGVILADPPWEYHNFTDAAHGAAASAIVTMSLDDIKAIPVGGWGAEHCILALWTTAPHLKSAFDVAEAWGFEEYVTKVPWVKTSPSTGQLRRTIGFWTMGVAEDLLIFRKGDPKRDRSKVPAVPGLIVGDAFWGPAAVDLHSSKPIGIHEWLEKPLKGPYLELFARDQREGWTCWGYDLGFELGPFGVRPCKVAPQPRRPKGSRERSPQLSLFGGGA